MIMLSAIALLLLNGLSVWLYRRLLQLKSDYQILTEVELDMRSQAHQLLVRRDQIELGLSAEPAEQACEKWKGDLAEYMEDYEQLAIQRSRRLNR